MTYEEADRFAWWLMTKHREEILDARAVDMPRLDNPGGFGVEVVGVETQERLEELKQEWRDSCRTQ